MSNPWESISLTDYENHMRLNSVKQLQTMNEMMKGQLDNDVVSSAMILGIAGGNGLEHVDKKKYTKVYGIDINKEYLTAAKNRYPELSGTLECLLIDVIAEYDKLPHAELLIANLFIEYIGYEAFQNAVLQVAPKYISCIIQINTDEDAWVSDSPYLHAFDRLDEVHHQMEEQNLVQAMKQIGFHRQNNLRSLFQTGKSSYSLTFIGKFQLTGQFCFRPHPKRGPAVQAGPLSVQFSFSVFSRSFLASTPDSATSYSQFQGSLRQAPSA